MSDPAFGEASTRSYAFSEIGHRHSVSGRPVSKAASVAETLSVGALTSDLRCPRAKSELRSVTRALIDGEHPIVFGTNNNELDEQNEKTRKRRD